MLGCVTNFTSTAGEGKVPVRADGWLIKPFNGDSFFLSRVALAGIGWRGGIGVCWAVLQLSLLPREKMRVPE